MKKSKLGLSLLLATSLTALAGCSIFNDDDLSFSNSYNVPSDIPTDSGSPAEVSVAGVDAKTVEEAPNSYCFKSIPYATNDKIKNTYGETGSHYATYNVNGDKDYEVSRTSNNYDLYVPKEAKKNEKHVVMLFIHGGAWIGGFKTDMNPYAFEFANKGYITATIKYTLLKKSMDDPSLSLFRDLDEIDACISSIKSVLGELGFDTTKTRLVIGGASSGAHLTMLYSYSRGHECPLPIEFLVNAVGPTDILAKSDDPTDYIWKYYSVPEGGEAAHELWLDGGLDEVSIANAEAAGRLSLLKVADDDGGEPYYWNKYQTMRIANGMCGIPFTTEQVAASSSDKVAVDQPNVASNSLLANDGGEDQISVTYWIKKNAATNKFPMICAYGGRDGVVGVKQYANLKVALEDAGIDYDYYFFRNSDHNDINATKDETTYNAFIKAIDDKAKAI